jgi:RNA polymerase sigma factor (sigma-70 family)
MCKSRELALFFDEIQAKLRTIAGLETYSWNSCPQASIQAIINDAVRLLGDRPRTMAMLYTSFGLSPTSSAAPDARERLILHLATTLANDLITQVQVRNGIRFIAWHYLTDPDDVMDLSQDVYLHLPSAMKTYRGDCNLLGWLRFIIRSIVPIAEEGKFIRLSDDLPDPDDLSPQKIYRYERMSIDQIMQRVLKSEESKMFSLHLDGYTHKEIAKILHRSEDQVQRRLRSAKSKIRRNFRRESTLGRLAA